jgi:hypothetical protein
MPRLASKPNHHAMENKEQRGEHREEKGKKKWKREKKIVQNERERKKISLNRAGQKHLFIRLNEKLQ